MGMLQPVPSLFPGSKLQLPCAARAPRGAHQAGARSCSRLAVDAHGRVCGAGFGALINSVIHCMMYSHYLWTSFGFNNPFKKMITQVGPPVVAAGGR